MLLHLHSKTSFLCVPGAVGKCDCGGRMCPEPGQMGNGGQRGGSGWFRGPCLDLWCGRGNNTSIMSTRTSHSLKFGWIINICTHSQIHRQIKQCANFKSLILFYREDVMQKLVVFLFQQLAMSHTDDWSKFARTLMEIRANRGGGEEEGALELPAWERHNYIQWNTSKDMLKQMLEISEWITHPRCCDRRSFSFAYKTLFIALVLISNISCSSANS